MANEISFSSALAIVKDGLTVQGSASKVVTLSGNNYMGQIQNIGTTTETLDLGDASTPGYLYLKNLDSTNFVEIGLTSPVSGANAMVKLLPGEFCFLPTRQTTIYLKADTAGVDVHVVLTEL